jgi:hypothetical protein
MEFYLSQRGKDNADVLIEPDVGEIAWTDFISYEEIVHRGETAAELKAEDIRRILRYNVNSKWSLRTPKLGRSLKTGIRHILSNAPVENISQ